MDSNQPAGKAGATLTKPKQAALWQQLVLGGSSCAIGKMKPNSERRQANNQKKAKMTC